MHADYIYMLANSEYTHAHRHTDTHTEPFDTSVFGDETHPQFTLSGRAVLGARATSSPLSLYTLEEMVVNYFGCSICSDGFWWKIFLDNYLWFVD